MNDFRALFILMRVCDLKVNESVGVEFEKRSLFTLTNVFIRSESEIANCRARITEKFNLRTSSIDQKTLCYHASLE